MRRKDKEISEEYDIKAIIKKAKVCRLGMSTGNQPYLVPLCFGYKDDNLYFHGSLEGTKIDLLRKNPNVCFEFDLVTETIESEKACDWSIKYQSVIGFGKAVFIEGLDEKREAIRIIMGQYSKSSFQLPDNRIRATSVIKVEIESMSGKQSGF